MSCYLCNQTEFIDFNTIIKVKVGGQPRWLGIHNVPICQACWVERGDAQLAVDIVSSKLDSKDNSGLSFVNEDDPFVQLLESMK